MDGVQYMETARIKIAINIPNYRNMALKMITYKYVGNKVT